ncbi:MAG: tetratricopeptide repeat protein, partial [Myxococcota bacterium]
MTPTTTSERFEELIAAFTNAFEFEVWATPTTVMLIGVLFGIAVAILAMRRNERAVVDAEGRQLDLMRRRDTVVDAIRALDLERDKLAPEDYERERQLLLAHGAQALRDLEEDPVSLDDTDLIAAIEARREALGDGRVQAIKDLIAGGDVGPTPSPAPASPRPTISPQWQGALITLGIFGVLGVLYLVLTGVEAANDRQAQQPATTSAPATPTSAQIPRTEAEKTFASTLESDPTNVEALNGMTDYEIRRQNWDEAKSLNERALAAAPGDPEARTWKALLVYRTGAYPEATRQLDSVIAEHPEFARGHQFRGMIHLQLKEFEPALARF